MGRPMGGALAAGPDGAVASRGHGFQGALPRPFGWFLKVSSWMSYYTAAS